MHGRRLWRTRDSPLVSVLSPKCAHSQKTENTLSHTQSKAQTDLPSPNRRWISPLHHSRPPAQIVIPRILPSKKSNRSSMTSHLGRQFETSLQSGRFTNTSCFETRIQNNSSSKSTFRHRYPTPGRVTMGHVISATCPLLSGRARNVQGRPRVSTPRSDL